VATELVLVDLDNEDKVVATIVPDGDQIKVSGPMSDIAKQIVTVRAKLMDMTPAQALPRLASYGWTNGHLALTEKK
jgi:hypothetical protein